MIARLTASFTALLLCTGIAFADPVRVATYDVGLARRGPGLLLKDILNGEEQVRAVVSVIASAAPDVLLLTTFDHDTENHALKSFARLLAEAGLELPHLYATRPNAGLETGLDMDGNGRLSEARDAQGYGSFTGRGGMAVLSRYPLGEVRDFSDMLWRDLPGATLPTVGGQPFPSEASQAAQRLSSVAHWDVPVQTPDGVFHLLAYNATTPVYDGDEDRNGLRNHDETLLWLQLLDGKLDVPAPEAPVIVLGNVNVDPFDGQGRQGALRALLAHPRLQDPAPSSPGAAAAANPAHEGPAALDTVDWRDPRPGNLRVDYILPDARLTVEDAGTIWPRPDAQNAGTVATASRHHLVWVDITLP